MPQVTWQRFTKDTSELHIVVGALPAGTAGERGVRRRDTYREELMGRVVAALKPRGRWALTSVSDAGGNEVRVAFGGRADAERVAVVVNARGTGRYAGWASQRRFIFDEAAERRLAAILGSRAG